MEIKNREVILTINLEGCNTNLVSVEKRLKRMKFRKTFVDDEGYQHYKEYLKNFKSPRKILTKISKLAQKRVYLTAEQVNFFISLEARPTRLDAPKEYAFWMKLNAMQRLDYHCRVIASNDKAVSYEIEIV